MQLGKLPTSVPPQAVDLRGATYTVLHPSESENDNSDGDDVYDEFGQNVDSTPTTDDSTFSSSEEQLYFHSREMDVEQTGSGERRVERIESTAYPDVQLEKDDRTTHDGVKWVCETVEHEPTPQDPTVIYGTWKKLD